MFPSAFCTRRRYAPATVTVDNLMSKAHTVFHMRTRDRKGLLYDVLRASKDLKVHISYAKVEMRARGMCEVDLFVARCTNLEEQRYLCQRYKENVERPVSVQIMTMGLDEITTELRVIAPLDISGFTRPRVLLDVTEALRQLKVMVFKARGGCGSVFIRSVSFVVFTCLKACSRNR